MNTAGIVRAVRWVAWGLVALMLTLCVTLALGMGWLRSTSGENWLRHEAVGQLNTLLVTEGMSVAVESLEGPLPEALRLRGLVVNDKRGPWLTVGQAEVRLDLAALLDPAVLVPLLAVSDAHLLRLPELSESAPSNAAFPQDLLSWYPSWLRFVRVDAVRLERLALPAKLLGLPEEVAGENVVFSAQGALSVPHAEEIRTNLAVRVDMTDMADSLALNAALHTTTGQLRLDVRFTEGENGLLARLAGDTFKKEGLPLPAGLELSLAGNAPLTNWDGDLSVTAAKLVQVQGRVGVSLKTDSAAKETLLRVNLKAQAEPEAPEAWQALGPVTVQTEARLAEDVLTVPEARLSHGAGEIVAENVRVSLPVSPVQSGKSEASSESLAGTVRLRLTRPQDLSALFAAQALPFASAEATLSVTGTVAAPQVELLAEVRDLQSPDASIETLFAEVSLAGTLTQPEARLRLHSPHMAVGGMEFQGLDANLRLLGEAVDVADLAASTGKAELAVDVTTPHGPAQLRVEAALRDAKLALSSLHLTGLGLGLEGNLSVPISGDVRASGTLTAQVHDWAALSALLPVPVRAAKAEARLVLSPDNNQSATLDWNVQNMHVAEVFLSSLVGNVMGRDLLAGPKLTLAVTTGEGQAGGGQVVDEQADGGQAGDEQAGGGQADKAFWQADKAFWKGATLNFSGDASNHTATFSAELNSLTYGRVGEAYPIMAKLSGALQNGKTLACALTVSGLGLEAVEGKVNLPVRFLDGLPDIPTDGPLSGEVRWHGALAQLWRLVPLANTRVRGDAEVDIKLGGTVASPRPTGGIRLKNVLFQDLAQAFEVSNIMAEISMQANGSGKARIEGTDGRKGSFLLSGTVGPAEAGFPLNIQGSIDRLMPLQRQDVRVSLSGTASVTGTVTAPDVVADITVNGGQVLLDHLPSGGIDTIDVVEATSAESKAGTVESLTKAQQGEAPLSQKDATSFPEVGRLKITVTVPNKFYVRGHGIESEWKGQLRINGPLANPAISGELSSLRGTLSFLGKTFVLKRGSVAFDGGNPPRPMLDIQLGYTQQNFTALITLSGPATRPRLKLSSQPTLPTDEIVAQILFGRSTGGLARGEALQLAATVASLTVFGQGGGLQDFTRSALGLDVLRVGSSRPSSSSMGLTNSAFDAPGGQSIGSSDASEDDLTLEVGKYVLDNVYVGLEQGMESRSTGVVVEIEITPSLSIEARTNGRGSDVEATWSWDY